MNEKHKSLKKSITAALFCALAYATEWIFHIKVGFLTFDIKDAVITVAAMLLGPVYAVAMGLGASLIELFSMGTEGPYGFIMDVLSTVTFAFVASVIYKYKKTLCGAIVALICAVFSMTAVMLVANLLITPYYMGVNVGAVVKLIPTLLLPFNLTKAVLNAAIVMMIYKPVVTALRRAKLVSRSVATPVLDTESGKSIEAEEMNNGIKSGTALSVGRRSILVFIGAAGVIAACLLVFFLVLHGTFEWSR